MKELALYVHIPFCKQKCLYCDFTSYSCQEKLMDDYVDELCTEILRYKEYTFRTVFIGGGTPTYLSLYGLNKLKECFSQLKLSNDVEFTIEGNPGTFTEEKLKIIREIGINRLSMGLQAWQNELLKGIGRIHSIEDFIAGYNLARKCGFKNINVDLMFGLPNQTEDMWKETLDKIVSMEPEHISCYSLIIEEGTPFYKMFEDDKLILPEEESERNMYRYAVKFLKEKGYSQYEISNFAKKDKECRHNLIYWNLEEYIGCGVGAHGYLDEYRIKNEEIIKAYIEKIRNGMAPIEEKYKNTLKDDMEEFMFMGLRKIEGIDKRVFKERFNTEIENVYAQVITKHKNQGLLVEKENRIFLSPKGIEFSNIVMSDFIILE